MKKSLIFALLVFLAVGLYSCSDNSTNPESTPAKGSIVLTSTPAGAQIWKDGVNSSKVTPDSLTGLDAGNYTITLKFTGYKDTTVTAAVTAGGKSTVNITLVSDVVLKTFDTAVRLYETTGTTAAQPSGLILSTGEASGIGSTAANRAKVDVYYSSTGYVIATASDASGLTRQSSFKVGTATDLKDGISSPVFATNSGWTSSVSDTETKYMFIIDQDGHYSKLQIVGRGGGVPGTPAYIDVKWIYNTKVNDVRFK